VCVHLSKQKENQEVELQLREQGVSFAPLSHTLGNLAFLVSLYVTCVIFSKNTWQRIHASLQE